MLFLLIFLVLVVVFDVDVPASTVRMFMLLRTLYDSEADVSVRQRLCIRNQELGMAIFTLYLLLWNISAILHSRDIINLF